ncbi:MAG: PEP-CTERM sorting domain-containing protein [Phycisphaerales bacterium]|nr:PEP-CTERM sorting domain-containing protein [Phycisphaerales bacterium]
MRMKLLGSLAVAMLVSPVAFAQDDEMGPGGTWDGVKFNNFYTPPLAENELYSAPVEYHPEAHFGSLSWGNWVGASFAVDYDATEVNFLGVTAGPNLIATSSLGTPDNVVTIWNPTGYMQLPPPSSVFTLANIDFAAINTTPANNGDIDITFDVQFNIYGATPFAPWTTNLGPSNYLYVGFTAGGAPQTPAQWGPVEPGEGTWIHNETSEEVLLLAGMWWGKATDLIAQGGIGVEHIPAPASTVLLAGGIGTFVIARRRKA